MRRMPWHAAFLKRMEIARMAKLKEKELVHWFMVAVASDPKTPLSAFHRGSLST